MPEPLTNALIRVQGVTHAHGTHTVLHNVSLAIEAGQRCAIVGTSGSGKSSLLNLIGLLDQPTCGHIFLAGRDMTVASADERAQRRNRHIGFVFQSFNLLPRLDALDNVALPLFYRGVPRQAAREAAHRQLLRVGLGQRLHHRPAQLSGGQRQRVAIARALVGEPALLLADEPTGNLDSQTAEETIQLLLSLNQQHGVTLVIVTHDPGIARRMQRCLHVHDGHVQEAAYE
ncbi:ABC transporter ATP-binding protein [Pseudomonas soli]|uniref:ABC transporter ATP-binding protein n=1 Tax=Pseudomonas soli TaxID=1306993 RepID=UPI0037F5B482